MTTTKPSPPADRRLAIDRLKAKRKLNAEVIGRFLEDHDVPIVEGTSCTFFFRGQVDSVALIHWIYGLASSQRFERLKKTDLWYLTLELPEDSRVEYKLDVAHGDEHRLILDPLNPLRARDPFGANSVCQSVGYEIPEWIQPDPEARTGELHDRLITSKAFREPRPVTVYLPARFRKSRRYPLLVVHDGGDYLQFTNFKTVLDNLIHRLEIPSMIVALTYPKRRLQEYANDQAHARFLTEDLIPALRDEYPLIARPSGLGLMGASFGAVAALSTAWRNPGVYGRLLLQSGSFAFSDIGANPRGPAFDSVVKFINSFRKNPAPISDRIFVSCGMYESLIYENRSLIPLLQATGMQIRYVEARDGHNWENWRDRLRLGLSWLFPGPLWMVYE